MQIYAAFMFAGIFTSLLIPETKRKTLEDLAGEYTMDSTDLRAEQIAAGKVSASGAKLDEKAHNSDDSVAAV
jgi:PHS family inorganic phosphate transporter-like MFS transporter